MRQLDIELEEARINAVRIRARDGAFMGSIDPALTRHSYTERITREQRMVRVVSSDAPPPAVHVHDSRWN